MARKAPAFVPVLVAEDAATSAAMTGWMEIAVGPAGMRILLATRPVDFHKSMDAWLPWNRKAERLAAAVDA